MASGVGLVWHFLAIKISGKKKMLEKSYLLYAVDFSSEPAGHPHLGWVASIFILFDLMWVRHGETAMNWGIGSMDWHASHTAQEENLFTKSPNLTGMFFLPQLHVIWLFLLAKWHHFKKRRCSFRPERQDDTFTSCKLGATPKAWKHCRLPQDTAGEIYPKTCWFFLVCYLRQRLRKCPTHQRQNQRPFSSPKYAITEETQAKTCNFSAVTCPSGV